MFSVSIRCSCPQKISLSASVIWQWEQCFHFLEGQVLYHSNLILFLASRTSSHLLLYGIFNFSLLASFSLLANMLKLLCLWNEQANKQLSIFLATSLSSPAKQQGRVVRAKERGWGCRGDGEMVSSEDGAFFWMATERGMSEGRGRRGWIGRQGSNLCSRPGCVS